ncbi:hypothetical protein IAQ61_010827, partial [Plenodomus lingam]|uniref:uncharacterized protein n=1 Tax=Leptosphaeria maculans TaxID=5022 RepID=UPI00331FA256
SSCWCFATPPPVNILLFRRRYRPLLHCCIIGTLCGADVHPSHKRLTTSGNGVKRGMETLGCGCFLGHFLTADLRRAGTCGKDPAMTIGTDWPPSSTELCLIVQMLRNLHGCSRSCLPFILRHASSLNFCLSDLKGGIIILWSQVRAFEEVEPDGLPAFDGKAR